MKPFLALALLILAQLLSPAPATAQDPPGPRWVIDAADFLEGTISIATARDGDFFVAGIGSTRITVGDSTIALPNERTAVLMRLAPDGTPRWIRPATAGRFVGLTVAALPDGALLRYVPATSHPDSPRVAFGALSGPLHTMGLFRFDEEGTPIAVWAPLDTSLSRIEHLATTPDGEILLAGHSWGPLHLDSGVAIEPRSGKQTVSFIARLDRSMRARWAHGIDAGVCFRLPVVAGDAEGNTYIGGSTASSPGCTTGVITFGRDTLRGAGYYLASFDRDGAVRWVRSGRGERYSALERIGIGRDGSIAAAGIFSSAALNLPASEHLFPFGDTALVAELDVDGFVAGFDRDGRERWIHRIGTADHDRVAGIDVGIDGRVTALMGVWNTAYVDAEPLVSHGWRATIAASFDRDGRRRWVKEVASTYGSLDYASLAVDSAGRVAVAHFRNGTGFIASGRRLPDRRVGSEIGSLFVTLLDESLPYRQRWRSMTAGLPPSSFPSRTGILMLERIGGTLWTDAAEGWSYRSNAQPRFASAIGPYRLEPATGTWIDEGDTAMYRVYQNSMIASIAEDEQWRYFATARGLWRTRLGTTQWESIGKGITEALPQGEVHPSFLELRAHAGALIVVGGKYAFRSTDQGLTFTHVNKGDIAYFSFGNLEEIDGMLYSGTTSRSGLLRSTDRGSTWRDFSSGLPVDEQSVLPSVSSIVEHDGALFIGTGQLSLAEGAMGVFRRNDSTGLWESASLGLPRRTSGRHYAVNDLASIAGALVAATDSGLYLSTDLGASWSDMSADLPPGPISLIAEHEGRPLVAHVELGLWALAGPMTAAAPVRTDAAKQIAIHPNPATDVAHVVVDFGSPQTLRIDLVDARGTIVRSYADAHVGAGTTTLTIDLTGIAAGTYQLVTRTGATTTTTAVVRR